MDEAVEARRRVPRPERERQMLTEARRLFAQRGFAAVSVDEIAAAVGVTKPLVYSYFGSKEGLFEAAVEAAGAELRAAVAAAAEENLPADVRIWHGILAVFDFVEESAESWDLLYPMGASAGSPFPASASAGQRAMSELLGDLFARVAIEHGVEEDLARAEAGPQGWAMTGATIAVASYWRTHRDAPREVYALRLMNFAWQGLGGLLAQRVWLPPPDESAQIAANEGEERFAQRVRLMRDQFLEETFRRMPEQFLPERAGGRSAVIEWQITGRRDGGHDQWQVIVEAGTCTAVRDGDHRPDVRFRIDAVDFMRLALGQATGPALFARGRLHLRGRPLLALRIAGWFRPARAQSHS